MLVCAIDPNETGAGQRPTWSPRVSRYAIARLYQQKLVLIDTLLHRYHWELEGEAGGPGAVGLIGGTRNEVIAFLNELSYGQHSSPGLEQNRAQWRKKLGWAGWSEVATATTSSRWRWTRRG